MRTLKELEANLKDGYEIVNFGTGKFEWGRGFNIWVAKGDELIVPKRFTVSLFIEECIEKGLVK